MGSTGVPDPVSVSVAAHGFTHADKTIQLAVLLAFPVSALLILFLTSGGPSHDTIIKVALLAGIVVGGDLLGESMVSVRRVDIDVSGVTFRYIFHSERGEWDTLEPGAEPARDQMWTVVRIKRSSSRYRGHWLTIDQALAILRYPGRPQWKVSDSIARSLGWSPT